MKISGIVENRGLTLYRINSLRDEPGAAGSALMNLSRLNINLEYITEAGCKDGHAILAFCVKNEDNDAVDKYIEEQTKKEKLDGFIKNEGVCVIGIYGPHFREKHSIAAHYFGLLGKAEINILGVSSSISSICCVINETQLEAANKAILNYFKLP